jgi:tetratricopeptide (TPR) repeat protein
MGRQEQLMAFRASVTQQESQTVIFAISGQGGVGKTTLLKQFRRITEECGHIAAYVDEGSATNRVEDVPEALHRLAKDFEAQHSNYKFEKFQEHYKVYRQKRQELETDPEAPSGIASGIGRTSTKLGLGVMRAIPGVGDVMREFVDSEAIAEKGGDLLSFAWKKFRDKDEVQLVTEPLEVLTPLFLEEVNRIATRQVVVLLLDTYEVTGQFLDNWLRAVLDLRYGDLTDNFRLCIAGRDPLDRNAWAQLEPCIARSPLEPFTEDEAQRFLRSKGITSEAVIQQIWALSSGGLPLLVSMMAQNAPTHVDAVDDRCEDAVERFLKWETDDAKKQMAQDGALPRVLNQDVVAALGDGQFDWLKDCAFVVRDGERWRYHLVVRDQMLRYQRQKSPQHWATVHGKLATYYDETRRGLGLETGKETKDEQWRELSLEALYHELCAAPQAKLGMALNGFLTALKASRVFAREWAAVMVQAGQEARCEAVQRWGERLRDGMTAQKEKRYEDAIPALTALLAETGIENKLKAVALDWRGCWYRWSNQGTLALKDLQQAVEIDAEDPEYWSDLALTYQNLKRFEEAIASYHRAIELDPNFAAPHNNLGNLYKEQKRYEEAIDSYHRAIELNPKWATPHNLLGNVYKEQKQDEKAIDSYHRAIELNPKWATPHNNLGNLYKEQKRYEEAIASYHRAIELDPNFAAPHNNLGSLYKEQKQDEKAIASYHRAIELDPNFAAPHNNLGSLYKEQKRYEEAIDSYHRAIELDPKYAYPHNNLGSLYKEQKQDEKAIASYHRAIELDPKWATPHNNLGNLYKEQKRYEEAIASYHRAIELDPKDANPHNNLGDLYEEQKQYEEAIQNFNRALEIDPRYVRAQESLGSLQYRLGDYDASLCAFQKAIDLQPDNLTFSSNLGYLHLLQGQVDKAYELIEGVIENQPFDRAWLNLGLIQAQRGQIEEARQSWQQGLNLMEDNSDWDKAVRYVFTVALGNPTIGLRKMQNLIDSSADKFTLRNALNDTTILSRSQQPLEGIGQMIYLLQKALSSF